MPKSTVLLILDGWGHREALDNNAIAAAPTPTLDSLRTQSDHHTLIDASGLAVGLPDGQMGNSEVGHLCLGSGRIVRQNLVRIDSAIQSGAFEKNKIYKNAVEQAIGRKASVHVLGLLSPGGVHSHEKHIHAIMEMVAKYRPKAVYVHPFLDGRDTPPRSAFSSLRQLEQLCAQLSDRTGCVVSIGSVCGRYYAMDRDQRWERIEQAWRLLMLGEAPYHAPDCLSALEMAYERNESDEFVRPTIIGKNGAARVDDKDAVLFMNFRADRARQLSQAITDPAFNGFKRTNERALDACQFVMTTDYGGSLDSSCAFPKDKLALTLSEYLAQKHYSQLHLAETEKYAHVTFFFNGGHEEPFDGEDRILVPSPKVASYDMQPEMSAAELTEQLITAIKTQKHQFIVCNYANGDMVGHTGVYEAALKAVSTVDTCIGKVLEALESVQGECLITADHGNCEQMHDADNAQAHTAHTAHLVPFIYAGNRKLKMRTGGGLSDVAPSVLKLMDLAAPSEMTGRPLFNFV